MLYQRSRVRARLLGHEAAIEDLTEAAEIFRRLGARKDSDRAAAALSVA